MIVESWVNPMSWRSDLSHSASWLASDRAIYSASVDDSATVGCLRDLQVIGAPDRWKIYPVVDLRVSKSPAQSESLYIVWA